MGGAPGWLADPGPGGDPFGKDLQFIPAISRRASEAGSTPPCSDGKSRI